MELQLWQYFMDKGITRWQRHAALKKALHGKRMCHPFMYDLHCDYFLQYLHASYEMYLQTIQLIFVTGRAALHLPHYKWQIINRTKYRYTGSCIISSMLFFCYVIRTKSILSETNLKFFLNKKKCNNRHTDIFSSFELLLH